MADDIEMQNMHTGRQLVRGQMGKPSEAKIVRQSTGEGLRGDLKIKKRV